ncbi:MAG TPA: hypothetical protein VHM47_04040 [Actinomycetota bacterium]|nr:hypothetical protein [Actinomycetota bacterium]
MAGPADPVVAEGPPLPAFADDPPLPFVDVDPPLPAFADDPPFPFVAEVPPLPALVDDPPLPFVAVEQPPFGPHEDALAPSTGVATRRSPVRISTTDLRPVPAPICARRQPGTCNIR